MKDRFAKWKCFAKKLCICVLPGKLWLPYGDFVINTVWNKSTNLIYVPHDDSTQVIRTKNLTKIVQWRCNPPWAFPSPRRVGLLCDSWWEFIYIKAVVLMGIDIPSFGACLVDWDAPRFWLLGSIEKNVKWFWQFVPSDVSLAMINNISAELFRYVYAQPKFNSSDNPFEVDLEKAAVCWVKDHSIGNKLQAFWEAFFPFPRLDEMG